MNTSKAWSLVISRCHSSAAITTAASCAARAWATERIPPRWTPATNGGIASASSRIESTPIANPQIAPISAASMIGPTGKSASWGRHWVRTPFEPDQSDREHGEECAGLARSTDAGPASARTVKSRAAAEMRKAWGDATIPRV